MADDLGQEFEKAAKAAVTGAMAGGQVTPAKAASFIGAQISHAARASKDTQAAVVGACRGGMGAALVAGLDLPETSVKVLESLSSMSLMMRVSPEDLMSWVMEGIAAIAAMATRDVRDAIQNKIDEKYMGAGEVFYALCEKAVK